MNIQISKIAGKAKAKEINISSIDELKKIITTTNWSPNTFNNNRRKNINFKSTSLMVLDIDGGFDLDSAIELFKDFKHIIGATKSHQKKKGDVVADRYRVVLFLNQPIADSAAYKATWD